MNEPVHPWQVTAKEAIAIQGELRSRLILNRSPGVIRTIGGVDVSYEAATNKMVAGISIFRRRDLSLLDFATAVVSATFPYIPGLLSFREIPAVLSAWEKVKTPPDCLICDGQGIAHPRRIGFASHLGLVLDLPTIGCAKSVLVGKYKEPGLRRGSRSPLIDREEQIGIVLRTRDHVKPVYVSPGHRMTISRAADLVFECCTRYRLPEPTRQAHRLVNSVRVGLSGMANR